MSILLESTLLQVLSEMEDRAKWTTVRVVAHVDHMTVSIVIGRVFLNKGIQHGTHKGKHIAELD